MPNRIFRGPVGRNPATVNLPVAGAYRPGILVTEDGSNLTMATAADNEAALLVLANVDFAGQDIATAYAAGDTGVAYRPQVEDVFQVRLAAATYTKEAPLAVGADGYLEAAATGDVVVAFFDGTPGAKSAGDLDDVRIANSFVKA
jgi:hypothetical protein